ncbi:hypothetical protein J2S17_005095 [Cytobacillus purgationiresistens]|uniref:Uncharacterized protein n=1 Tax=Cytobacillus purgationiresistens TaxID=863449 RepID=A0ABU0APF7_9BACI|nr:hypothetical protein [Cytobacillus purgationiresistens]
MGRCQFLQNDNILKDKANIDISMPLSDEGAFFIGWNPG